MPLRCSNDCHVSELLWAIKCARHECLWCDACLSSPPPTSARTATSARFVRPHALPAGHAASDLSLAWSDEFDRCESWGQPSEHSAFTRSCILRFHISLRQPTHSLSPLEKATPSNPAAAAWVHEWGYVRNGEPQFYDYNSVSCTADETLLITAREHPGGMPSPDLQWDPNAQPVQYTSGSITSRQEATGLLTHGQYDSRIRFDLAANAWPAWWAVGSNTGQAGAWPRNGEIDMFEYRHGHVWAQLAFEGCRGACWSPDPRGMGIEGNGLGRVDFYPSGGPSEFASSFHDVSMVSGTIMPHTAHTPCTSSLCLTLH